LQNSFDTYLPTLREKLLKEASLCSTESLLVSQNHNTPKVDPLKMGLRSRRPTKLSPCVAGVIAAETLRQEAEADISETSSFFIADLTRAVVAVREWKRRLPDVLPFYGE
jgi:hypothetical protein